MRVLGWAFAAFVLALVLLPLAGYAWLTSAAGEAFLRDQALSAANGALQGRVELDRVSVAGLLRVEIEGARLYAPDEAEPVVSLDRLEAEVRLTSLLARWLDVTELELHRPTLRLDTRQEPSNLARAIAPKEPRPPEPEKAEPTRPPKLTVRADDVRLVDGRVQVLGETPVDVQDLDLEAALTGSLEALDLELKLGADAVEPAIRRVALDTELRWEGATAGNRVQIDRLQLAAGKSSAALKGDVQLDLLRARVTIDRLVADPGDVQQLAPGVRLLGPVSLAGNAALEGPGARADLRIVLPAGRAELEAKAELAVPGDAKSLLTYGGRLTLADVALSRIVEGLPDVLVQGSVDASLSGPFTAPTGPVRVDLSKTRYNGVPVDELLVQGELRGQAVQVETLRARLAGTSVRGRGLVAMDRADASVSLDAPDLARLRTQLARMLPGVSLPEMQGAVSAEARVRGPYKAPQLAGTLKSESVEVAGQSARGLVLEFDVADPRLPLPKGAVKLEARQVVAGGRVARGLDLDGHIDGSEARVDATGTLDGTPIDMRVRAERQKRPRPGVERWDLHALRAEALGVSMRSEGRAVIEYGHSRGKVDGLVLAGDFGRLSVDGEGGTKGKLDATIGLDALRLDELPEAFLPRDLRLGGAVSGTARVTGTAQAPQVEARLSVRQGRYADLAPVGAELTASLVSGRVKADGDVRLPEGGTLRLEADVPAAAPSAALDQAVTVSTRFDGIQASLAQRLVPDLAPVQGTLTGEASVSGTWGSPKAAVRAELQGGAGWGVDTLFSRLEATLENGRLAAQLVADRPGSAEAQVELALPLDAREVWLGRMPVVRELPVEGTVSVVRLDLGWAARLAQLDKPLRGNLAGRMRLEGTLSAPRLDGTITARQVAGYGYENVDLTLDMDGVDDLRAQLIAELAGEPTFELRARAEVPPGRVADLTTDELLALPLTVEARLVPTKVERLLPRDPDALRIIEQAAQELHDAPAAPGAFAGLADATLTVRGTALQPDVKLLAAVQGIELRGQQVGRFDAEITYARDNARLWSHLSAGNAGSLVMQGTMKGSLGARAWMDEGASAVLSRDATLRMDATALDLALFNGLSPSVRDIQGVLDARATKTGPLNELRAKGDVKLRDGRIALVGYGSYRDLQVETDFDWPELHVRRLEGRAGPDGSFNAKADLVPLDARRTRGSFQVSVKSVPVVQNFQTRGYLSMTMTGEGVAEGRIIDAPTLRITDGLLAIPDRLQKNVQKLDRHPDIVFASELRAREEAEKQQPVQPPGEPWRIRRAKIEIPNDFRIDAPLGSELLLGSDLALTLDPTRGEDKSIELTGDVRIVRGTINLVRRFSVDEGTIRFTGLAWDNPELNIKAHHEGGDGTIVRLDIGGTLDEPTQNFTAVPPDGAAPMDENEILYYLATGQRQTRAQTAGVDLGSGLASGGLSLLGSAAASVLTGALESITPGFRLDTLQVEANLGDLSRSRVRGGKYLFDGQLYLGGQISPTQFGATNELNRNNFELEAEFKLGKETSIRGIVGDQNRHSLEVVYQKNFPNEAQRPAVRKPAPKQPAPKK